MSLANNLPTNTRLVQDGYTTVAVVLPVAANTVNTPAIDLVQATPYPVTEAVIAQVTSTVATGTANSKNINFVVQDSADNVTFVNVALLGNPILRVTDSSGTTPVGTANILLPPSIRRYVRVSATGEANGGTAAGSGSLALLF